MSLCTVFNLKVHFKSMHSLCYNSFRTIFVTEISVIASRDVRMGMFYTFVAVSVDIDILHACFLFL